MLAFQLALFDHLLIQVQFNFFITANYIYNTDKLKTIPFKKKVYMFPTHFPIYSKI